MVRMRTSAGGIEYEADRTKIGMGQQPVDTGAYRRYPHSLGPLEAVRLWIDANEGAHPQVFAMAQDLHHQIGTDVTRADDSHRTLVIM
ncbi:hypothetical protein D3C78_1702380 [compost metagenome]